MIGVLRYRGRRLVDDGRWIVIAVHVAILGGFTLLEATGGLSGVGSRYAWLVVAVGVAILVLDLRLALAVAGGARPRGAVLTLFALAALVYLPLPWLGWSWTQLQVALTSAVLLTMSGPGAVGLTVGLLVLGPAIGLYAYNPDYTIGQWALWTLYVVFAETAMTASLYGAARLVVVQRESRRARVELAAAAVVQERLRVSRDLHDLLGQSLSAVSLKSDLAVRLLSLDPAMARTEIRDIARTAREALRGVRAITHGSRFVSLRGEIDGAQELLRAAHITTDVHVDLPELPPHVDDTLAWAVREGVTNILRHSRATTCTISACSRDGIVHLSVVNDGAEPAGPAGSGLTGLAERVRALNGRFAAQPTGQDSFRLALELPGEPL